MISTATASDIRGIVNLLEQQAQHHDWPFDADQATETVRRQCVLAGSEIYIIGQGLAITGVIFAQITNNGMGGENVIQITNLWTQDQNPDQAQRLVDRVTAEAARLEINEVLISQWQGSEFDLRGLEPVIITARIR